jgi:hypothetical protein
LATDIVLVELNCYYWKSNATWPLLVVPTIVAQTEIVERSVIQVTVLTEGTPQVEVRQEGEQTSAGVTKRVTLTEEAFWELLKEEAPTEYEKARNLIDRYRTKEGFSVEPTQSAIMVRLYIQDTGQQASVFFINKSGHLSAWPGTIGDQLAKAGLNRGLIKPYDTDLRKLLRMPSTRKELARNISEVNIDDFITAVDTLAENIQLAEPVV